MLGAVIAVAAPLGDLFESAVKRDLQREGHRPPARPATAAMLDRIDSLLFAAVAAYYTILRSALGDPRTGSAVHFDADETRIALLGATGSIGRQAVEIVESHPELELVAAASGSQPVDGLAPLTQVGGDLTELLDRAQPDVVLNAVVGFAGLPATLWALEHGVTLALANKESLVAAGELALAAQERGGGLLLPVDSEHSAAFQCLEGRSAEQVDSLVLTGSGGPFRGRSRDELEDVTPEEALAHPTWQMGPKITVDSATLANKGLELIEAHFLFGLPYERIEVVLQPTSVVHALVRFRDGASLAHLGYPDMRVPISFALTYPERSATPVAAARLLAAASCSSSSRPTSRRSRCSRWRGGPGEDGGTYPCAFNAANEVAVAAFLDGRLPFLGIAATVEETLAEIDGAAARDLDELVHADAEARRLPRGPPGRMRRYASGFSPQPSVLPAPASRQLGAGMSVLVSIAGLAFLILIHEAGHFFTARAVGMRPRRFYIGFPPAVLKTTRNGIEYGLGRDPARRLREDPGHAPARAVRPGRALRAGPLRVSAPAPGGRAREAQRRPGRLRRPRANALARARAGDARGAALGERPPRGRPWAERARRRARLGRLLATADLEAAGRDRGRARREPALRDRAAGRRSTCIGIPSDASRRVGDVIPDSPAAAAGLAGRRRDRGRQPRAHVRLQGGSRRDPPEQRHSRS